MANFVGAHGNLFLFTEGDQGIVIDSSVQMIIASGQADVLTASRQWVSAPTSHEIETLAVTGFLSLTSSITAAARRGYTIPRGVQEEAKKALKWRREEKRGGTSVGLNTARTLARGGQIGIEKVRHIAKYFPRHEVDKKAEGWKPGEDGFPSNGRIAWALWGGEAGKRWASAIVEREDKKAMTADAYPADTSAFEAAYALEEEMAPEFITRVWLDGSGMDRLYKIDMDGMVYVWDDSRWDDLGYDFQDIWNYDNIIDDGADFNNEVSHLSIDPESAIYLAARFAEDPFTKVTIEDIDAEEAQLVAAALEEIDWEFIDGTLLAAGETPEADGQYTPEERSENAAEQLRDATGKFASTGSRVMVGGRSDLLGKINKVNPTDGTVGVLMDDGRQITISAQSVATVDQDTQSVEANELADIPRLDTSGILAEPRQPSNRVGARIPGTLPPMTRESLGQMLADWPAYVADQRSKFVGGPGATPVRVQGKDSLDKGQAGRDFEAKAGKPMITDAYDHPLLTRWLQGRNQQGYNNSMWYNPITAAAGNKPKALTPDTSDVQPIYMAVVDAEDPQAVLNLVSFVPASDKSTAPMIYKREKGKWVRDPQTLADLKSPTPPPVVPLDSETLDDVLTQVDQTQTVTASIALAVLFGGDAIVAAGGPDRNRGNAEALRRYWTRGAGAAKIRWGQGGDWKRCVRQLTKYLGPRAKGYCQLRHKEVLGYYTSTHAKMERAKSNSVDEMTYELDGYNPRSFSTEVTEDDLNMPLSQILSDKDELYDFTWEPEDEIIFMLQELAVCTDKEYALVAAGGADRNRGGAENLRKYWTVGKGGLKIRWGTPGDWTRCVRQLNKYMGPRSKGYCALRHKEMNGVWPGDKKNRQFAGREYGIQLFSTNFVRPEETVLASAALRARRQEAIERVAIIAAATKKVSEVFNKPVIERTPDMEEIVETSEPVDIQEIKTEDLTPTQGTIEVDNVKEVMDSEKPVDVLITEEGALLVDGHHRTTARKMKGEKTVPAEIYIEETE